jgi:hypothetical protein
LYWRLQSFEPLLSIIIVVVFIIVVVVNSTDKAKKKVEERNRLEREEEERQESVKRSLFWLCDLILREYYAEEYEKLRPKNYITIEYDFGKIEVPEDEDEEYRVRMEYKRKLAAITFITNIIIDGRVLSLSKTERDTFLKAWIKYRKHNKESIPFLEDAARKVTAKQWLEIKASLPKALQGLSREELLEWLQNL